MAEVLTAPGGTPLTVCAPAGAPKAGLVVLQEGFGVTGHIVNVGSRLADEGYVAVIPHLFHRAGDPRVPYEDQSDAVRYLQALTAEGLEEDLDAALNHLAALGFQPAQLGAIGFCHGGGVALLAAAKRDLSVGITFYGGGIQTARYGLPALTDLARSLKVPWLGLYGALDASIPEAQLSSLESAAKSSGQPVELICYPDAGHGFFCEERASYNPEVSVDAWRKTLEWIDKYLDSRRTN